MTKPAEKINLVKNVSTYVAYILVVWGFYRFLFKFPDEVEELLIKPLLWLIPVYYFAFVKERATFTSLGFTLKNFFPAVYFAVGLGAVFVIEGILTNYLKYGALNFGANLGSLPFMTSLGLSFATAFTEETAFRGYVFSRLWIATKNEWTSNIVTTLLWTSVHVPIAFFVWKLNFGAAAIYLILTGIFGFGSSFVFARTRNIVSSILLHVLWQWPIILFR